MDKNTKKAIKTVYDYLAVSNKPQKVDAIFIATSFSLSPCKKASELFKEGYSKSIFIVGKTGTFSDPSWKEDQAIIYKKELIKFGVPDSVIVADPIATNSLEEALTAIPLMKKHGINPKKVIIVDRPEHQRREWATFAKTYPQVNFLNCPAEESIIYNQKTLDILVAEFERLVKYGDRGDLVPQEFPEEVLEAWKFLNLKVVDKF